MQLRLFKSRMSVLLMRSGWSFKIAITGFLCLLLITIWWLCIQNKINNLQKDIICEIADLSHRKIIFDEALAQYQALHQKIKSKNLKNVLSDEDTFNFCQVVADQSRAANLILETYTAKKLKDSYKQMVFSFLGGYRELINFLHKLDQIDIRPGCNRLRVVPVNHKLQIAYVCGIHTSVK